MKGADLVVLMGQVEVEQLQNMKPTDLHFNQWLFLVPLKVGSVAYNPPIGSIYHLYTTYSPCLLGGPIMLPIPPFRGTRNNH